MYQQFFLKHLSKSISRNGEVKGLCPFHDDTKASFFANIKTGQAICHGCNWKGNALTFAKKRNISFEEVPGYKTKNNILKGQIAKTYQYFDENQRLLYEIVRMVPKAFRARHPDDKRKWIWNLKGVQRILYKLPSVIKSQQVIIVEGEKDVDKLTELALVATTNPGGAGKWRKEYNHFFKDKEVVLIPDNDQIGKDHIKKIADNLQGLAKSIKMVELPDVGPKGDVSDYLEQHSKDDLMQLIHNSLEYQSKNSLENEIDEEQINILDKYSNLEVLGENENGNIFFYSMDTKKLREINLSKMTNYDFISLAGIQPSDDLSLLKQSIAFKARMKQLNENAKIGQGIWYLENKLLVVNGDEASVYDGISDSIKINLPQWKNYLIEFQHDKKWFAFDFNSHKSGDVFDRIKKIVQQWNWSDENDSTILTALIMATPFQMIWSWRPHIYITGQYATGKTAFLKLLESIYGNLSLKLDGNNTEAGLYQNLKNNMFCLLLDEFEKNTQNREQILKLLRASSKGGQLARGTRYGKPQNYKLIHMVWLASIEVAMKEAADLSRFIILRLKKYSPDQKLQVTSSEELKEIFTEIILTGLKHYKDFKTCQDEIINNYHGNLNSRLVECYSVPLAIIQTLNKGNAEEFLKFYEENHVKHQTQEDEERLIECIINSKITIRNDGKYYNNRQITYESTIGDLIEKTKANQELNKNLNLYGISVTKSKEKSVVAFHANSIETKILYKTEWAGLGIKDILLRVNGAFEKSLKLSGRTQRTICIPIEEILKDE